MAEADGRGQVNESEPQTHTESGAVSLLPESIGLDSKVGRPITKDCGTEAAYKRHRRHGETPCDSCKAAYAAAHRAYYAKRKGIS